MSGERERRHGTSVYTNTDEGNLSTITFGYDSALANLAITSGINALYGKRPITLLTIDPLDIILKHTYTYQLARNEVPGVAAPVMVCFVARRASHKSQFSC